MRICIATIIAVFLSFSFAEVSRAENLVGASLKWDKLPPLPDDVGFAGAFAGSSNGALVVAGGANFPDGKDKVWHDRIFVLTDTKGKWQELEQRLPRAIGYGVSVTTPDGIICIGGSDAKQHFSDVFRMEWKNGNIEITPLAPLPFPLANAAGAAIDKTIYVAGGSESPDATKASKHFLALNLGETDPKWKSLPEWPGPERILPVAGVQEKSFFLISGARLLTDADGKPTREFLNDAYRYSPDSGWKKIADPPRPAVAAPSPAAAIGTAHLFVFGGDDGKYFFGPPEEHRGFASDILAYHTITNTWTRAGELAESRAVTPLVAWRKGFVIPSGEIRARVRTPACAIVTPVQIKVGFGWLNYLTLASYPLLMLAISWFVGKKHTSDEFFRGGQRIPWWAAGISIYATMFSSITYMAVPAKLYLTDWAYFIRVPALLLITPIVAYVYLPFFRRLNVTSAYEYLEKRFNLATRWFGSLAFLVMQLGRTAIVLFLPSLALATVTQWDIVTCIVLMGVISILMTFLGGVEAVVWTDVAQTVVLVAGVIVSLIFIYTRSDLTIGAMFDLAQRDNKLFGSMSWKWDWVAGTAWVIFVGALFENLIPYTASQDVVQRYFTTKNEKQAARAIMTNAVITLPAVLLFFAMGTALYVFYKQFPGRLNPTLTSDAIFPLYMVRELPAGVAGLVVAGIFAAAQPTSNLNSMATAWVTDFHKRLRPDTPDEKVLKLAEQLTVFFGILGTGAALLIAVMQLESLWDLFLKLIGLTGGALAGLFALGIFSTRAHGRGAMVGAISSIITLTLLLVFTKVNLLLYGGIGIVVCFVVGYIASLIIPGERKSLDGLTVFTSGSAPKVELVQA